MTPNADNLTSLFTSYTAVFNKAMAAAPVYHDKIAMRVPSSTRENQYGWLAALPSMREWLGDRVVNKLAIEGFAIKNRDFEATVSVKRNDIEDDQYGVYSPIFEKMGRDAAQHPDKLVLSLLKAGFATTCYDGQFFFDTDHPVGGVGDVPVASVSNFQGGSGAPWFVLDASQALKPLVFQDRQAPTMERIEDETNQRVFLSGDYFYGVRSRCNAGYGLWQLAYGSKEALSIANYEAARAAMMSFKQDNGDPLNLRPTHLVVPPSMEAAALAIVKAATLDNGATNIWAGSAEVIVTAFVA